MEPTEDYTNDAVEEMVYDAEITAGETEDVAESATALPAVVEPQPQAPQQFRLPQHTQEEIAAFKSTIKASNRDMTDAQFTVFMAAAKHLGLDPLARQVVPILMSGRMTVQTTIDGFRLIAERTRKYRGQIGPEWCGPDGQWREVWLEDGPPAAARVGVLRADFAKPMWGVARTKSYAKGGLWNTMPDVMIAKVAESLALRKTFPNELSGAYTAEELDQAIDADSYPQPTYAQPQQDRQSTQPAKPTAQRQPPARAEQRADTRKPASAPATASPASASAPTDAALPTWSELSAEAQALDVPIAAWRQQITTLTGKQRRTDPATGNPITISAQLTDDDKRTMMGWLAKRRQQFEDAAAATPPLETLQYAGH